MLLLISVISEEEKTYKNDYRLQVFLNLTVYTLWKQITLTEVKASCHASKNMTSGFNQDFITAEIDTN